VVASVGNYTGKKEKNCFKKTETEKGKTFVPSSRGKEGFLPLPLGGSQQEKRKKRNRAPRRKRSDPSCRRGGASGAEGRTFGGEGGGGGVLPLMNKKERGRASLFPGEVIGLHHHLLEKKKGASEEKRGYRLSGREHGKKISPERKTLG